jgi:sugar phosphate isomerase/epimerase
MNNKSIFVSTTYSHDNSKLKKVLDECLMNGIINVELGSNHCHEKKYTYLKDYSLNYLVHNYFPIPKNSFVVNIASQDEIIHRRSIKHIKNAIDLCSGIDAKLYTFHPGFLTDPLGSNQSSQNYDFRWDTERLKKTNYEMAWDQMVGAFREIIDYAREKQVAIAFETEGSFHKKDHLMMQQPKEYERFLKLFPSDAIGINLNIGHLILAANAFEFSYQTFVDIVADYVVAMELSHNNGVEDQHLPLQSDGWYWPLILDKRFSEVKKILEFRNTNILKIKETLQLFS